MEIIWDIVGGLASAVIGFAIGSVVFVLVRLGRWALLGTERGTEVTDPQGQRWAVRIPLMPYPARF